MGPQTAAQHPSPAGLEARDGETGNDSRILLLNAPSLDPSRCRPRMAAAAVGINKQGTLVTMESCIRHGRGANGHTVKVFTKPI